MNFRTCLILLLSFYLHCWQQAGIKAQNMPSVISLNGESLYPNPPDLQLLNKISTFKETYEQDTTDADNLIWYGRFVAYGGNYHQAIELFTKGIKMHSKDARFYRHRGHRYITTRKFDLAIADLEMAAKLIEGTENEIEPDGMPNAQNIQVSSLHGNIWYHLGLGYYLTRQYDLALQSFLACLESTSNDDNVVSATHWIYTIACRQMPRGDVKPYLNAINDNLQVIENHSYYQLCRFYKGLITEKQVLDSLPAGPARDAALYGLARWHACHGNEDTASQMLQKILSADAWASFGFIAAEADLYFKKP